MVGTKIGREANVAFGQGREKVLPILSILVVDVGLNQCDWTTKEKAPVFQGIGIAVHVHFHRRNEVRIIRSALACGFLELLLVLLLARRRVRVRRTVQEGENVTPIIPTFQDNLSMRLYLRCISVNE
jgi:hypothetical protein